MTLRSSGVAVAAIFAFTLAAPASAQTLAPAGAGPIIVVAQASPDASSRRSRKRSETRSKREPTASQMAARERQKKCAAEWKSAKAAGSVASGMRWPKFWSQCNARLKGNSA